MRPTQRTTQRRPHLGGLGRRASRTSTARADVLDIGGGTGGFAVRVAELGARVDGRRPEPGRAGRAGPPGPRARRRRSPAQQGDLSTLLDVTGPDSADVVLCHGVLEVVDDPAAALATLRQVLRPGRRRSACWSPSGTRPWWPGRWPGTSPRPWRCSTTRPAERDGRAGHRFTADEVDRRC